MHAQLRSTPSVLKKQDHQWTTPAASSFPLFYASFEKQNAISSHKAVVSLSPQINSYSKNTWSLSPPCISLCVGVFNQPVQPTRGEKKKSDNHGGSGHTNNIVLSSQHQKLKPGTCQTSPHISLATRPRNQRLEGVRDEDVTPSTPMDRLGLIIKWRQ